MKPTVNCPKCKDEMVIARATEFGEDYYYCRACKKELKELQPEEKNDLNKMRKDYADAVEKAKKIANGPLTQAYDPDYDSSYGYPYSYHTFPGSIDVDSSDNLTAPSMPSISVNPQIDRGGGQRQGTKDSSGDSSQMDSDFGGSHPDSNPLPDYF